jgi:hypothetical protein
VPTIVAKREGILDLELYNAPRSGVPFTDEDEAHAAEAGDTDATVDGGEPETSDSGDDARRKVAQPA